MKTISPLALLLSFTSLVTANPILQNQKRGLPVKAGYTTTFADDFTGPAGTFPSSLRWNVMTGTKYPGGPERWGNNEVQTYARDYANIVTTAAQTMSIKATRQPNNSWKSGRMESIRGDFIAKSGGKMLIETRIKLGNAPGSSSQGIWPAFWAMGSEFRGNYQNWPAVTEWDIVESINGQARLYSVAHCGTAPGGVCNEFSGIANGNGVVMSRGVYHTVGFQVDRTMVGPGKPGTWRDEKLMWWLDGVKIFTITGARINNEGIWNNLAHKGHYLIFNVAVGGNWAGPPNAATRSHEVTGMEIDYVAVYNQ